MAKWLKWAHVMYAPVARSIATGVRKEGARARVRQAAGGTWKVELESKSACRAGLIMDSACLRSRGKR